MTLTAACALWPRPSCEAPATLPPDGGACFQELGEAADRDVEASLAVNPLDGMNVLVAWSVRDKGEAFTNSRVVAAATRDGGASWSVAGLRDPALEDLPGTKRYAFDQRALFGPDGAAYVLFGGEMRRGLTLVDDTSRITLARSTDGGITWTYHRVAEMQRVVWDYYGFAVAPDTGHLHVVTGEVASGSVWFWRSEDQGQTWSSPVLAYSSGVGPYGLHRTPELSAGPDGLVVIATLGVYDTTFGSDIRGVTALVSHDGGRTFGPERPVADHRYFRLLTSPVLVDTTGPQPVVHVLVASSDTVFDVRSLDAGKTWQEPEPVTPPLDGVPYWAVPAVGSDGSRHILVRTGDDASSEWTITLDSHGAAGHEQLELARDDRAPGIDHYGGLGVGPDGTVWAAFGDPRDGNERVALVRMPLA